MGEALRLGWGVSMDDMLQRIHRGGGSDRLVNQLLAVSAAGYPPDANTDAALADVVALQRRDGLIGRAAFAIRAIQLFGWQGRRADFDRSIDHARTFLTLAKPTTGDDRAMLVLGLAWSGASKPLLEKALQNLIAHQRPDGGWGGNDNLPSHPSPPLRSRLPLQKSI